MKFSAFFKNKNIFITGGTGSIGSTILKNLLSYKPKNIKIFSRDEYKQYQLKFKYSSNKSTKIEFILGDIRDYDSLLINSQNTDILFHCAAFKHVPQSEKMPEEFIKTNILGSINIRKIADANNIPTIVSISSDKAVQPSNVMGLTKAIQEKIFSSHFLQQKSDKVRYINVRFGNVIGTKGSLFPIFYHQIKNKLPLTITDPEMTRFFMTQNEAVDLIFWSTIFGCDGEIIIKKMNSIKIGLLAKIFLEEMRQKMNYRINIIGLRVGEKFHESLIAEDELFKIKSNKNYYIIKPYSHEEIVSNIINYDPKNKIDKMSEFTSDNSRNYFSLQKIRKLIYQYINEISSTNDFI